MGPDLAKLEKKTAEERECIPARLPTAIGLNQSLVALVESEQKDRGFLIAETFESETGGKAALFDVFLIQAIRNFDDIVYYRSHHGRILISRRGGFWTAVDPEVPAIAPCPSRRVYPTSFISTQGYREIEQMMKDREYPRLVDQLSETFEQVDFSTRRKDFMNSYNSSRCLGLPLIKTRRVAFLSQDK